MTWDKMPGMYIAALAVSDLNGTQHKIMMFVWERQHSYTATSKQHLSMTYIAAGIGRSARHVKREVTALKNMSLLLVEKADQRNGDVLVWNLNSSQWRCFYANNPATGDSFVTTSGDKRVTSAVTKESPLAVTKESPLAVTKESPNLVLDQEDQEEIHVLYGSRNSLTNGKVENEQTRLAPAATYHNSHKDMSPIGLWLIEIDSGLVEKDMRLFADCVLTAKEIYQRLAKRATVSTPTSYFDAAIKKGLAGADRQYLNALLDNCTCAICSRRRWQGTLDKYKDQFKGV